MEGIVTKEEAYNLSEEELLPLNIRGWHGDGKIFRDFIDKTQAELIIEVGTWCGMSAINMGSYCKEKGMNTKIYCVDTWLGAYEWREQAAVSPASDLMLKHAYPTVYYQFISNVIHSGLQDYILPFVNTSLITGRFFQRREVKSKLIYIDASHEYEDVVLDLKYYYPLLEEGGIIFGDDYPWPDVNKAVNEFGSQVGKEVKNINNHYWYITK